MQWAVLGSFTYNSVDRGKGGLKCIIARGLKINVPSLIG